MKKNGSKIFMVGAVLVLIGAVLTIPQFQINDISVAPFVFSLGVVGVLVGRYMQPMDGNDFRIKRLRFQQFIGSALLVVSACLMFVDDKRWVLSLLIAAMIELVVVLRMPRDSKQLFARKKFL